ncbi:MAG TPA: hypothetical protein VFR68_02350 [Candidatus Dormibacteraeota bacterium]|nr:hypothetical protein [Candidatus Dormibacteraeota bacterium]
MSASDPADDIATFAARVRAELADLPSPEKETLLEDLEQHLAEITAEGAGSLEEQLGPPEQYARELRAAYTSGQPPVDPVSPSLARSLQEAARLTASNWYREIRAFLPSLRPAWWVLRGYLVVLILAAFVDLGGGSDLGPLPSPFSKHGIAQILATGFAIWLSVRLGRRRGPLPQLGRVLVVSANVFVVLVAMFVLGNMRTLSGVSFDSTASQQPPFAAAFAGGPVTNIYPYSQDGKPLTNVLLYDQDGQPLTVQRGEANTNYPLGADGKVITNAYPLTQRHANGDPVVPPRVALPPWPSTSPSASPSPSPSPSVSPTR